MDVLRNVTIGEFKAMAALLPLIDNKARVELANHNGRYIEIGSYTTVRFTALDVETDMDPLVDDAIVYATGDDGTRYTIRLAQLIEHHAAGWVRAL